MSVLERIAYLQGRRDEVPNVELARELVAARDKKGVREIAENLWNEDAAVQADCIKALYEVGLVEPKLIVPYLIRVLETCRPKEIPQYAESVAVAVNGKNRAAFVTVLGARVGDMPAGRAARVRKVIRAVAK